MDKSSKPTMKKNPTNVGKEIIDKIAKGKSPIPELELGFAIAAGSLFADETFKLMKDTISAIIREYGVGKINYGLVVFGDTATIKIRFNDFTDINNLLQFLSATPKKKKRRCYG